MGYYEIAPQIGGKLEMHLMKLMPQQVIAASSIICLFILSYLSKPLADIQYVKEKSIFDKNKINKSTWKNPSEPNAQRKRYLKTLEEEDRRVA